ncbi:MAG TPA: calcium-binding protein [Burkholderiaceae bacterium]
MLDTTYLHDPRANGWMGIDTEDPREDPDRPIPTTPGGARPAPADNFIYGNAGINMIAGTLKHDQIMAGAGNDTVSGFGGDDRIYGEGGDDVLYGGTGQNILVGGDGADVIWPVDQELNGGLSSVYLGNLNGPNDMAPDVVVLWGKGTAYIHGFHANDKLAVFGYSADHPPAFVYDAERGYSKATLGTGMTVFLVGVDASTLHPSNNYHYQDAPY